jgi:signal transduction histidine kinase
MPRPILIAVLAAMAFAAVAAHGVIEYRGTKTILSQFAEARQDSDTIIALDKVLDGVYRQDVRQIDVQLRALERLTAQEPLQQKRLKTIGRLIAVGFDEQRLRREVDAMRATEEQERAVARARAAASSERVLEGIEVSTSVAAVLLLLTFFQFGIAARANQRARRESESANRLKDQFLATVSHELRTPLTAILGWSAILQESAADPRTLGEGLTAIQRSASVQKQLIEDMLDVSRIQAGKLRLSMRALDLSEAVRAAIDSMRPAADAKSISIVTSFQGSLRISGDPDRLQQIVWNLMTNAVKFTPSGGEIAAVVWRGGAQAVIEIRDSGEGIDAAFLPHVFEPFRQSDSSRAHQHKGLGLGLSIVKYLVEAHGGTVSAASDGAGRGTTFRVSLPVMAIVHGEPVRTPSMDAA